MLFALTIVAHGQVHTIGILVTDCFAIFAFVNWTDERVVVPGEPLFPLRLVGWRALGEDVVEEGLDSREKVCGVGNIVEVD